MRRAKAPSQRSAVARKNLPLIGRVAESISNWTPRQLSDEHAELCRECVRRISPPSAQAAKVSLVAVAHLVRWCHSQHMEITTKVLFDPNTYERWFRSGLTMMSAASRDSYRTRVRALAFVIEPTLQPPSPGMGGHYASEKSPYSDDEVALLLLNARAQSTPFARARVACTICLGVGAGASSSDMRYLTKESLHRDEKSGALILTITGRRARVVPVLEEFADRLEAAASTYEPGALLLGGTNPERVNISYSMLTSYRGGSDLPKLEIGRLRATWWRIMLTRNHFAAIMTMSGMAQSPPREILKHLATPDLSDLLKATRFGIGAP